MNFADFKPWLDALQWLFMLGLAIATWLRKPGEDAGTAVADLREDVDERLHLHGDRITRIETELKHMPTKQDLEQLEGTVRQIDERTRATTEALGHMRHQLDRIEDYLRQRT